MIRALLRAIWRGATADSDTVSPEWLREQRRDSLNYRHLEEARGWRWPMNKIICEHSRYQTWKANGR